MVCTYCTRVDESRYVQANAYIPHDLRMCMFLLRSVHLFTHLSMQNGELPLFRWCISVEYIVQYVQGYLPLGFPLKSLHQKENVWHVLFATTFMPREHAPAGSCDTGQSKNAMLNNCRYF